MSKKYAMGIDLGNGGVRVGLFTHNIRPDMENHRKYQFYLKNMRRPTSS